MKDRSLQRPQAGPVDLLWKIDTHAVTGGVVLRHQLTSPSTQLPLQRVEGRSDPISETRYQGQSAGLFERLEALLGQKAGDRRRLKRQVYDELLVLGQELWRRWVPPEIQRLWPKIDSDVGSLILESDEPWIPWEIAVPDPSVEPAFLCCRCAMGRWFSQPTPPAPSFALRNLCLVAPGSAPGWSELVAAQEEARRLHRWALDRGIRVQMPPSNGAGHIHKEALVQQLRQEPYDLFHFSGHGHFGDIQESRTEADHAVLVLGRQDLRPVDLHSQVLAACGRQRPLVFLNACRSGRQGHALTGLGGWPDRWVRQGHAGALLSPQWQVHDGSAADFSELLYKKWADGLSLGQGLLETRREMLAASPWDPTPLAYCLYGHPRAGLGFGPTVEKVDPAPKVEARPPQSTLTLWRRQLCVVAAHPPKLSWAGVRRRRGFFWIACLPLLWIGLRLTPTAAEPARWIQLQTLDASRPGLEGLRRTPIPLDTLARLVRIIEPLRPSILGLDIEVVDPAGHSDRGFQALKKALDQLPFPVVLADTPHLGRFRRFCLERKNPGCRLGHPRVSLDLLSSSVDIRSESLPFSFAMAPGLKPSHWASRAAIPVSLSQAPAISALSLPNSRPDERVISQYRSLISGRPLILGGFLDDRPIQLQDRHRPNYPTWHPNFGRLHTGVELQAHLVGHAAADRLLWSVDDRFLLWPICLLSLISCFSRGSAGFWICLLYLVTAGLLRIVAHHLLPLWPVLIWASLDLWKRRSR